MRRTIRSIIFKVVSTVNCRNRDANGIEGIVIEETRNTIKVLTMTGSVKTIIKEDCWFYVNDGDCTYLVPGHKLILRE
ncbi:ribonuclease P protein subunit [Vulcanisaeta thermophila]|uniref:ribonuclease P protein subunit n=1 Tax=Vulcanisaeta thermophila TaxID=867917 RepID=UPI000852DDCF|nr:ribonuclease P protein subunit [Vulcanisaeta thermophila]